MQRHERLFCDCGGEITRPVPERCPHCGAEITGVRRAFWPRVYPVLLVGLMFAALVAFLLWRVSQ